MTLDLKIIMQQSLFQTHEKNIIVSIYKTVNFLPLRFLLLYELFRNAIDGDWDRSTIV
jgi:hypothetical protein